MTIHTERLSREWFESIWNRRDESLIQQRMHTNCENRTEKGVLAGSLAWHRQIYLPFVAAFPDIAIDVTGVVASGDEAVIRWRVSATHLGEWSGVPASDLRVGFSGMSWFRFRDRRIIETEDRWNRNALRDCLHTGLANASVNVYGSAD